MTKKLSDSEQKKEDWMNTKWRPLMGYMYMLVCVCDFILFPILWSLIQVHGEGKVEAQWLPITLQGAGLFHVALGAILGVAAFGRTQEKLAGANNGSHMGSSNFGPQSNQNFGPSHSRSQGSPGGFGNSSGFNQPSSFNSSSGGRPMGPGPAHMPEL